MLALAGGIALASALAATYPPRRPGPLAFAGFMAAWLASELAPQVTLLVGTLAGVGVAKGGLWTTTGLIGLALTPVYLPTLLAGPRDAEHALATARHALDLAIPTSLRRPAWAWPLFFVHASRASDCETASYGPDRHHRLDLHRPAAASIASPRGRLIYVHGGGWVLGFRRWQGRLLFRRLLAEGWEVASVGYRLAPRATWPEPLDDVRRAITWLDARWPNDGAPTFLAGNSAGAQLAARIAFAADGWPIKARPLSGCLAFYGVHDLLDRHGHWPHGSLRLLWERLIAKRPLATAQPLFADASPIEHALTARDSDRRLPPTLLIHGDRDTLVPPAESRALAAVHRDVVLIEVPGAQHAFDVLWSHRALAGAAIAATWLSARAEQSQPPTAPA